MYSVQLLSPVWLFETPWNAACQVSLSITNYQRLLMSIESVMPFNHLNPLSSPSPPVFNLSQHQGFSYWGSLLHQVDKVLEFQLQHQFFNEYSGLISFRMNWLNLLAIQGTLKIFSNTTVQKYQFFSTQLFFIVQPKHP